MNTIFTLIGALLPILTSTLESYKAITPSVAGIITGIEGAIAAFVTEITGSGATSTPTITAISLLSAIQAAVSILQTQTTISPASLVIITAVDTAISAGIAAANITSVDPSKLQPITPA